MFIYAYILDIIFYLFKPILNNEYRVVQFKLSFILICQTFIIFIHH